jgi:hypothetical protein
MKKLIPAFFAAFLLVFISCNESQPFEDFDASLSSQSDEEAFRADRGQEAPVYDYKFRSGTDVSNGDCYSEQYRLYGGQTIDVGSLTFSNDDEFLYVTYSTEGGWYLKETHLYVGCPEPNEINNGIPSNNAGNPVIGHFPFTMEHSPMVTSYTYQIALSNFDDCLMGDEPECLIMATHASVALLNSNNEEIQSETAFQECDENTTPFEGNRWGCYSSFCPEECEEEEDPDLAWLFKTTNSDSFVKCIEDDGDFGYRNEIHYDWLGSREYNPEYPIYFGVEDDCINYESAIGVVEINLDLDDEDGPTIKLDVSVDSGSIDKYHIYVGWTDPRDGDGELLESISYDSSDLTSGTTNFPFEKLVANWEGTNPGGVNPGFYIIVKLEME